MSEEVTKSDTNIYFLSITVPHVQRPSPLSLLFSRNLTCFPKLRHVIKTPSYY